MQQFLRPPGQRVATAQPLAALPLTDAACPLRASGTRGKRRWSNAFLHPDEVGTPATGRQSGEPQKTQACPKAGPNRSRHRYADPRTATLHARAKLRPKRPFLLDRARPVFFSARPKRKWGVHWDKPATRLNSAFNGTHPAGGRLPPLRHHRADRINTLCGSAVPTAACCSPECGHSRPPRRSP